MSNICYALAQNDETKFEESAQQEWAHKFEDRTPENPITFRVMSYPDDGLRPKDVDTAVALSFGVWEQVADVNIRMAREHETPDIVIHFRKKDDYWKNRPSVLAYAYLPGTSKQGIVVFNDIYLWSLDGKSVPAYKIDPEHYSKTDSTTFKTYLLPHTMIHEFGHTLGLRHSANTSFKNVMNPYYNKTLELSPDDVYRIVKKYGNRIYKRWHRFSRLRTIISKRIRRW